jgi:hypothetical protein
LYHPPDKLEPAVDLRQLPTVRYLYGKLTRRPHAIGVKRHLRDAGLLRPHSRQHIADELHPIEANDGENGMPVG